MTNQIHDYYIERAQWIAHRDNQAGQLPDAAAWQEMRPKIRQQFLTSVGLEVMPERCDLKATVMGTFSGEGYTATKLAYQLLPDCWGSAHFYRPTGLPADERTPAVLYACGHSMSGVIAYQHHGIGWARRGYSCLIFDTVQQHDNPGTHQGLNRGKTPEWIALGYSAAGGELFNGLRALDLLLEQPGVDPQRVGVTGLSGGGSQSFLLAVADERLKAVATLCGVSDPLHAIRTRQVHQHCDCIYMRNVFAQDLSLYAALIAPRALLFCFARQDGLFTPTEFRELHQRTRVRFERLGVAEQCALCEYDGPHGYGINPDQTTAAIHRWFDRHVAGREHPAMDPMSIRDRGELLDEPTLSVFHGQTPEPNRLDLLPQLLSPRGQVRLPESAEHWDQIKQAAAGRLRSEVFHLLDDVRQPQELELTVESSGMMNDHRYHWQGRLEGMTQSLMQLMPADQSHEGVIIGVGEREQIAMRTTGDLWGQRGGRNLASLGIEPRAAGLAGFPEHCRTALNREGCLVGLTPTMMMVQDLHHLWPKLKALPTVGDRKLYLYGKGEGAIAMLYHALLHADPNVAAVILEDLPASHTGTACQIMRVLRVMDIPHAVGLLAPIPVALIIPGESGYEWYVAERAHQRVRGAGLVQAMHVASALEQLPAASDASESLRAERNEEVAVSR